MYASIAIIVAVIALWSWFDSETAPGVTEWRPYGIPALVGIGCAIYFSPETSPYLVAAESFLVSLIANVLISGLVLIAGGDRPSDLYRVITWSSITALLVVTVVTAYFLGGVPALYGALAALSILGGGAIYLKYHGWK